MLRSLYSGTSGLRYHQVKMDVVANNIANVNTVGYKKSAFSFQDLLSQILRQAVAPDPAAGRGGINPAQVGLGVTLGAITSMHTQGSFQATENPTDLAIQGDGFFILSPDGGTTKYYTRAGAFGFDAEGYLIDRVTGCRVLGSAELKIPLDAQSFYINPKGELHYLAGDGTDTLVGTIHLAKFSNPSGLFKVGSNLYLPSPNAGTPAEGVPGEGGRGTVLPGALEMANVDLAEEFTQMITAQRGFQANARTITVSDQMLEEVVNLKR